MVAIMAATIISEILFYINFFFEKLSRNVIIANVCNAFDEAEIFEAKTQLCTIVDALNSPKVVNTKGTPNNRMSADHNQ